MASGYSVEKFRRRFQTYIDESKGEENKGIQKRLLFTSTPRPELSTPEYVEPTSSEDSWNTQWDTISHVSHTPTPIGNIQNVSVSPPPGFAPLPPVPAVSGHVSEVVQYMHEATLLGVSPGAEMQKFVAEQQARKERLEIARLSASNFQPQQVKQGLAAPKIHLRSWDPKEEDLDSFLHRFERIMKEHQVSEAQKISHISSLLTGEALKIFTRMDADSSLTYEDLTRELRHCFGKSAKEYQQLFQETLIKESETSNQYLGRLFENFRRMFKKSYPGEEITVESLLNHILRMQFLKGLDRGCRFKLAENEIHDVAEMGQFVDRWRNAKREMREENDPEEKKKKEYKKFYSGGKITAAIEKASEPKKMEKADARKMKRNDGIPTDGCYVTGAIVDSCSREEKKNVSSLPVTAAIVNGRRVTAMRDTGSTLNVVARYLVHKQQYTGRDVAILTIDGVRKTFPTAVVNISCSFIKGKVLACVIPKPVYPLIVGNVEGACRMEVKQPLASKAQVSHSDEESLPAAFARAPTRLEYRPSSQLKRTRWMAEEEAVKGQQYSKQLYDKKAKLRHLPVQGKCLVLLPTNGNNLSLQWKGPFKVVKKLSNATYLVKVNGKSKPFHISKLKEFLQPPVAFVQSAAVAVESLDKKNSRRLMNNKKLSLTASRNNSDDYIGTNLFPLQGSPKNRILNKTPDLVQPATAAVDFSNKKFYSRVINKQLSPAVSGHVSDDIRTNPLHSQSSRRIRHLNKTSSNLSFSFASLGNRDAREKTSGRHDLLQKVRQLSERSAGDPPNQLSRPDAEVGNLLVDKAAVLQPTKPTVTKPNNNQPGREVILERVDLLHKVRQLFQRSLGVPPHMHSRPVAIVGSRVVDYTAITLPRMEALSHSQQMVKATQIPDNDHSLADVLPRNFSA